MVVAVEEPELDLGIVGLELLQHARQPVDGHRGKRADAHGARIQPADRGRGLLELLGAGKKRAHRGHQLLPVRRQLHASALQRTAGVVVGALEQADEGLRLALDQRELAPCLPLAGVIE